MLTPQEITEAVFVKVLFNGYDMTGVDDFLEKVAADYSALYKENAILKGKIKVLVEKVEEYRSTEDSMRMALLTAQRMGEDIMADANKKRSETLSRTDDEIRARLAQMEERLADEEARLKAAAKETAKFVEISQEIMRRHAEFLSKLNMIKRAVQPVPVQKPPEPTREERIADAASQINSAVEKLTAEPAAVQESTGSPAAQEPGSLQPAPPVQESALPPPVPPVQESAAPPPAPPVQQPAAPPQAPSAAAARTESVPPAAAESASAPPVNAASVPSGTEFDDESEPTKPFVIKGGNSSEDDIVTPRPKFDFENLKFGSNFNSED